MKINFYATLRLITGKKTVILDLADGVTVREMLEDVFKLYPPLRKELLTSENELLGHVHVFVNGRDVPYLAEVLETRISQTDKLDIFPAVGGGQVQTLTREMRGLPYFLLKEYLLELGGRLVEADLVIGDGWSVRLTKMEPFKLHALQVGQTRLEMELEEWVADDFLQRLAMKTLRVGA